MFTPNLGDRFCKKFRVRPLQPWCHGSQSLNPLPAAEQEGFTFFQAGQIKTLSYCLQQLTKELKQYLIPYPPFRGFHG